ARRETAPMGDLGRDAAVEPLGGGRFRGELREDWEIWGPMGGYVASVALRAVAGSARFGRPASFACHYLSVAAFDAVDLTVTELRTSRVAASYRVEMTQGERRILEAIVWTIADDVDGTPPAVDGPAGLPSIEELLAGVEEPGPPFPFWNNFDVRPLQFRAEWPPTEPLPPVFREWLRFLEGDFTDPWVDACRALVAIDVVSWPSASRPHAYKQHTLYAPSLDLYVAFHRAPSSEWLLLDGHSPVGEAGLLGWTGRLWTEQRRLVAS